MTMGCISQQFSEIVFEELGHAESQVMSLSGSRKLRGSVLEISFSSTISHPEGKGPGRGLHWAGKCLESQGPPFLSSRGRVGGG